jgi:outer membrane receptor protein involved in Fe transport
MQKALLVLALLTTSLLASAQTGSISGTIIDAKTKEAIIGASILVKDTQLGTSADLDGKFTIKNVPTGTQAIVVTFVTYATQTISDIVVVAGQSVEVKIELSEESKQLDEVVVTGQADRSDEMVLLRDRKRSIDIVQTIGAQELSRKGVSNAEGAVTQVTGVSKQEGVKNVFVRGLGDRYNSTSLNGLPLPSEDPQFKNISLDLFSSDIISNIDVNKTFGSKMFGDVAGANIDIKTKELYEDQQFKVSTSFGVNSQTLGKNFVRADGTNYFGTASSDIPVNNLDKYSFENSFQPLQVDAPLVNSGFSLSGGKNFTIGNNQLRTFFVGSMSSEYLKIEGNARQIYPQGGLRQNFDFDRSEYNASQLAMGNLAYDFGKNKISYNVIYIHDNGQSVTNYQGFSVNGNDDAQDPNAQKSFVRRQQQNNNVMIVNQLLSKFQLTDRIDLDLGGSFNTTTGDEPDRRSNFYVFNGEEYVINTSSPAYNHRFYSTLKENDVAARALLSYSLRKETNNKISLGYNIRSTHRTFDATQFNFDFSPNAVIDPNNPDAVFNQGSIDDGTFELETARGTNGGALKPFTYSGDRTIHAGFLNVAYDFTKKLTVNAGLRVETFVQSIDWDTNLSKGDDKRDKLYYLPSLNVKYNVGENDILRFASSQTYTYPQFKELAPFYYEDVNISSFGNPKIKPSENFNVDLRYEHYFNNAEFVAVTGFYKNIKYPISRVQVTSAANELSYVNSSSGAATIFGGEVELRKTLVTFSRDNTLLDFGVNVSYLYSHQKLEDVSWDDLSFDPNNKESALEGASPWLVNSDITFKSENENGRRFMTTVLFNYSTNRIYSFGAPQSNEDIVERFIPRLDFISSIDLNSHFNIGLKVNNLLNAKYQLTKQVDPLNGPVQTGLISNFQKGITTSLGLTYTF